VFQNRGMDRWGHTLFRLPHDLKFYFERFNVAPILIVDTNAGILKQLLRRDSLSWNTARVLHSMGLQMETAFGCILRLLLRPVPEAWQAIVPTVVRMGVHRGRPAVCLQERSKDRESFDLNTGGSDGGSAGTRRTAAISSCSQYCALLLQSSPSPSSSCTLAYAPSPHRLRQRRLGGGGGIEHTGVWLAALPRLGD